MKSSSSVIHGNSMLADVQSWTPAEFEQDETFSAEMIRASASKLFGMKDLSQDKKPNLIKANQSEAVYQSLQLAEMDELLLAQERPTPQQWTPFLERPNSKKIADEMIEIARDQSDEIIRVAQENARNVEQEAYQKGIESAKSEISETLKAAAAVINVAREWRADMMNQAEPMIMDLVKKIAQKMFGDGVVLDNVTLQQHFDSVLESARSLDDLRIYMNPADAKELGPDWREYQASVLGHKVEIVSNESIKRGGCYIQGEWGTADALVETQLEAILKQFSEVEKPVKEEEE